MMRQMKVCKFEERDRRGNVSRGRDRVLDFPGLACKHCANKNNMGRYFPVSAKNLTDNTANSMLSHMSSCSHCPDNIKASISFLSHRSAIQKAELKGSWKKTFYNKVWERLHTEKEWVDVVDDEEDDVAALDGEQEAYESEGMEDSNAGSGSAAAGAAGEDDEEGSESGDGQSSNMSALIKAAAIWLTKDEKNKDDSGKKNTRGRSKRGADNNSNSTPRVKKEDDDDDTPGKRRRVAAV
ncbi:MAG: hypothetical protein SGARI_004069 [Bacillariaceae sp.]